MVKPHDRAINSTFLLFRIFTGLMFAFHGTQKLWGWPGGKAAELLTVRGLGGIIELTTGVLVTIGLLTRPAAFLASGTMAFAYWRFHGTDAFLPIVNKGELAVMYCFAFLFIWAYGAGKYSLDATLRRETAQTPVP